MMGQQGTSVPWPSLTIVEKSYAPRNHDVSGSNLPLIRDTPLPPLEETALTFQGWWPENQQKAAMVRTLHNSRKDNTNKV